MSPIRTMIGFALALSLLSLPACSGNLASAPGEGLRACPSLNDHSVASLRTPCRKFEGAWYRAER